MGKRGRKGEGERERLIIRAKPWDYNVLSFVNFEGSVTIDNLSIDNIHTNFW